MNFSIQPLLESEKIKLIPLWEEDFERLYKVASDPEIWKQHPNKNRYEIEVFRNFFKGALESKGAFLVLDKNSDEIAGSTRFYGYNETDRSIFIGYTFYAVKFWGKGLNHQAKKLMLDYIFQFVEKVIFHVGASNIRSQKAMEKLGAVKTDEIMVAYFGEPDRLNFQYEILKEHWLNFK